MIVDYWCNESNAPRALDGTDDRKNGQPDSLVLVSLFRCDAPILLRYVPPNAHFSSTRLALPVLVTNTTPVLRTPV